jgi:hypothetical protein
LARSFVEAVRGQGRMLASGDDGRRALEAAVGAYLSAATGRTVELPLDPDSPPSRLGAMGVPDMSSAPWSPFVGTRLFRPLADPLPS